MATRVTGRGFMIGTMVLMMLALGTFAGGLMMDGDLVVIVGIISVFAVLPIALIAPGIIALRTKQVGTRAIRTAKTTTMVLFTVGAAIVLLGPSIAIGGAAILVSVVLYALLDVHGRRAISDGTTLDHRGALAVAFVLALLLILMLPKFGCTC